MARYPRLMPAQPRLLRAEVLRSERRSPAFHRVTIGGPELDQLEWVGFDQWFRLFIPPAPGAPMVLPSVSGRTWWQPYLAIAEHERPHCSNYTVAAVRRTSRGTELDIDVVVHRDPDGEVGGGVARWATGAVPGSPTALLDQGLLFDPPPGADDVHLVADETGVPAVRGILRDLPADATGSAILEVPTSADVEPLEAPESFHVTWIARDDDRAVPGVAALAELRRRPAPAADAYAFVVGEQALATGSRRHLHQVGLAKSRITFSGFWKHTPHHAAANSVAPVDRSADPSMLAKPPG